MVFIDLRYSYQRDFGTYLRRIWIELEVLGQFIRLGIIYSCAYQ